MKAVFYSRSLHEESIKNQQQAIKDFAKQNGVEIIHEFIDQTSGIGLGEHPEFSRMIGMIKFKELQPDFIYIDSFDRFSRDVCQLFNAYRDLASLGVKIVSVKNGTLNFKKTTLYNS
jgi:Site-specific recombinases, DNA invertase Pin homologs